MPLKQDRRPSITLKPSSKLGDELRALASVIPGMSVNKLAGMGLEMAMPLLRARFQGAAAQILAIEVTALVQAEPVTLPVHDPRLRLPEPIVEPDSLDSLDTVQQDMPQLAQSITAKASKATFTPPTTPPTPMRGLDDEEPSGDSDEYDPSEAVEA